MPPWIGGGVAWPCGNQDLHGQGGTGAAGRSFPGASLPAPCMGLHQTQVPCLPHRWFCRHSGSCADTVASSCHCALKGCRVPHRPATIHPNLPRQHVLCTARAWLFGDTGEGLSASWVATDEPGCSTLPPKKGFFKQSSLNPIPMGSDTLQ